MKVSGFTLVEVVVALCVLGIGVLGTARAAGALSALTARSARTGRIAAIAERHLESARAMGCSAGSGRTAEGVLDVVWSVSVSGGVGRIAVRVYWPDVAGMRADTFVSGFQCP